MSNLKDDILIHRRGFFINKVKAPLMKIMIKLANLYPNPTKENTRKPNTHALIDVWDEFFEHEDNPMRDGLFRAIRRLSIGEYEHDPYYGNRIDWFLEKLVEKYLNGEWIPRKAWSPTGCWNEPSVLEEQELMKKRLLKAIGSPLDTSIFHKRRIVAKIGE